MVVNQMMVAMATHAYQNDLFIYHVASSVGNPLRYSLLSDVAYNYFSRNPCVSNDGKIIRVKEMLFLKSMSSFRLHMFQRYKAPLLASLYSTLPYKYLLNFNVLLSV
jgi:fatty acyl-CoA reductase